MNWDEILKIVVGVMVGFGGVSGIIIIVIKFSANFIAKRLQDKYTLKLNMELEKYRLSLENKIYISKTKFDAEFEIYRELSKAFCEAVRDISLLIQIFESVPSDLEKRKQYDIDRYDAATKSVIIAQNILYSNMPFIPSEFVNDFKQIISLCNQQCRVFSRRWNLSFVGKTYEEKSLLDDKDYERTTKINEKYKDIIEKIREYLARLDVIQ